MEESPSRFRRSDEPDFNLREWALKAQISRENTNSRRFSASNIRSFREDNRSFRSQFTISSTASSPGYTIKGNSLSLSLLNMLYLSLSHTFFICRWNRPIEILVYNCSQRYIIETRNYEREMVYQRFFFLYSSSGSFKSWFLLVLNCIQPIGRMSCMQHYRQDQAILEWRPFRRTKLFLIQSGMKQRSIYATHYQGKFQWSACLLKHLAADICVTWTE